MVSEISEIRFIKVCRNYMSEPLIKMTLVDPSLKIGVYYFHPEGIFSG